MMKDIFAETGAFQRADTFDSELAAVKARDAQVFDSGKTAFRNRSKLDLSKQDRQDIQNSSTVQLVLCTCPICQHVRCEIPYPCCQKLFGERQPMAPRVVHPVQQRPRQRQEELIQQPAHFGQRPQYDADDLSDKENIPPHWTPVVGPNTLRNNAKVEQTQCHDTDIQSFLCTSATSQGRQILPKTPALQETRTNLLDDFNTAHRDDADMNENDM